MVSCTIHGDKKHVQATWLFDSVPVPSVCRGLQGTTFSVSLSPNKETFDILHSQYCGTLLYVNKLMPTWPKSMPLPGSAQTFIASSQPVQLNYPSGAELTFWAVAEGMTLLAHCDDLAVSHWPIPAYLGPTKLSG